MQLRSLRALRYRSLRDETIPLSDLNLFIGTNASGKSTILDALRFLHEGVQDRDFKSAVFSRGGIIHLAWKGEDAHKIDLHLEFLNDSNTYEWSIQLARQDFEFEIHRETLFEIRPGEPRRQLLQASSGQGWWWSGEKNEEVRLDQPTTACALANAAPNAAFPGRAIAEFVGRWGFFDPSPFLLRRGYSGLDPSAFDPYGRNLAERLLTIRQSSREAFTQIVSATQSVLGLPTNIELREARDSEERVYFVQHEPGLKFSVHQIGASSGTLRMLALMTTLFGEADRNVIAIEEPENYVHPTALASFAQYLIKARDRVQILVTTHSPLLLDFLDDPGAVCIVRHGGIEGTRVTRESNSAAVRQALEASGFGLGEFYETKGFGS
ncbi:MAG TPA: AAA family ATPase [Tepidisphaeraceae bacterium]|nr:AAA family ATPase [Tepidisphaeraceae bacterium]